MEEQLLHISCSGNVGYGYEFDNKENKQVYVRFFYNLFGNITCNGRGVLSKTI